ncbi:unnamed protein product [Urochloa decumbens]|uniref:DUF6598 domain-containing protein n=1 Tax=Urochloa decumbens TaxID=240449 RepID=A0ABC9BWK9_9POAL
MENLTEQFLLLWKKHETPEQEQEEENREREEEQKKIRARWKPSELKLHMEILLLINRKKMMELEELYAKKRARWKAGEKGVQAHNKLMAYYRKYAPAYLQFHDDWIAKNPGLEFEAITPVRAMLYTNLPVPQYVYDRRSNSLQIYHVEIKVGTGPADLQWPLQVFGVVAVRDSIDSMRNIIFNRDRDDCQTLTEKDPCLALTGPTRAVGMNDPVTIEAELKVKGAVKSKDRYFILDAKAVLSDDIGVVEFAGARGSRMEISLGALLNCVEATVFFRVIGGTWPAGLQGHFAASTSESPNKVLLVAFGGDGESIRGDGNMTHLRHVVSVEDSGELIVSVRAWRDGQAVVDREEVRFKAKLSGRSFGSLNVCSCHVGVLVAWSRIRPMCNDKVPALSRQLCHF